ncbi:MAG: c-type cytochrome [Flavobacteriaceae bacterium]|nr:c-type cytochrome [Flavobacteriaceae bacterium]
MYKKLLVSISILSLLASCNQSNKEKKTDAYQDSGKAVIAQTEAIQTKDGYALMKENCYVCHNPEAVSHDTIIAPPFKAVKMHYMNSYDAKESFVTAMVNWVQNPSEEKALMKGAVTKFKVMPPLPLETSEIEKIATYIYDNDVEEPIWMKEHMKEMKGKGMMNGNGMGKGKGNNKGMKKVNQLK